MALSKLKPVAEIMFGDFMALAADQWINSAAKFHWMYNGKIDVPMILRTPMGGKRGYGPTHSQSIEKHFLGVPGTSVLCLHHRYSPAQLYRDLLATITAPTLVVENKILYTRYVNPDPPAGYSLLFSAETFPTARLMPRQTPDLTIVAIGGMSVEAEEALCYGSSKKKSCWATCSCPHSFIRSTSASWRKACPGRTSCWWSKRDRVLSR